MSTENHFQVPKEKRESFVEGKIITILPSEERAVSRERVKEIVINYEGQDVNALSVLSYAAKQGRFDEFAAELERFHQENLQFVHPEARRVHSGTETFFLKCYTSLDIKPVAA